jgi:glycosyltransferase involved in cell wall biosynthesis
VHAHTPKAALIGLLAAFFTGGALRIYHVRGLPLESAGGLLRIFLRWCERFTCALAHTVVCQSTSLRRSLVAMRLCRRSKCVLLAGGVGNGVDAEYRFHPARVDHRRTRAIRAEHGIPSDAFVAGYVGRLARDKGLTELAEMWDFVRAQHPGAHLLVLGALDARMPAENTILERLRALPDVHCTGRVDEPVPYYAVMSALVVPSYREGMPNVALEAAAMRLPVVATRTTGCVDAVIEGITGLLVEARSGEERAAALDLYIRHPDLRERHALAGRARMLKDFRQAPVWAANHALYNSLLESAAEAPAFAWSRVAKRCFDVIGASALLVITAPLLALAALAIRATMGKPIFFRQLRAGLHGRPFTLHKFRTMRSARGADGELLPAEQRITRLGSCCAARASMSCRSSGMCCVGA